MRWWGDARALCACVLSVCCGGAQNLTGKEIPLFVGDVWCVYMAFTSS
jgi:hypothetical protein